MVVRILLIIPLLSVFAVSQQIAYPDCSVLAKGAILRAYAAPFDVMAPGRPKTVEKLKCGQRFTIVAQGNAGGSIWDRIETPKQKRAWVLNALVSPIPTALPQKLHTEHHRRARITNALQGAAAGAAIGQAPSLCPRRLRQRLRSLGYACFYQQGAMAST